MELELRLIDNTIDFRSFHCTQKNGDEPLTRFLSEHALDNQKKRLSVTWLALDKGEVAGYFSLSAASISISHISKQDKRHYPNYEYFPAILIGKFAVDDRYRGQGVGKWMMKNILTIVLHTGKHIGCCYLMVESKEESAGYYEDVLRFKPVSRLESGHLLMTRKLELTGDF